MVAMLEPNPRRGIELRFGLAALIVAGMAWAVFTGDARAVGAWALAAADTTICLHILVASNEGKNHWRQP